MRGVTAVIFVAAMCGGCEPKSGSPADKTQNSHQATGPAAPAQTQARDGKPIVEAIKGHLGPDKTIGENARFTTAWTDLDGDGRNEAIVYLLDPSFCGSGGCNSYVLAQSGKDRWQVIGDITVTHPPIYKLPRGKDGWAELGVTVSGGGLARMVMAVPHGDVGYAHNPTVAPARPIDPGNSEVLISEEAVRAAPAG